MRSAEGPPHLILRKRCSASWVRQPLSWPHRLADRAAWRGAVIGSRTRILPIFWREEVPSNRNNGGIQTKNKEWCFTCRGESQNGHFPPQFSARIAVILSTDPRIARWIMTGRCFSPFSLKNFNSDKWQWQWQWQWHPHLVTLYQYVPICTYIQKWAIMPL